MTKDNKEIREKIFKNASLFFCILYYFVTALNIYIAILQILNGHYLYFAYYVGLFILEKMILLFFLRRMGYEQPEQLVLTDILNLGFLYLKSKKKVRDICTFFIAKFYLSVIPTVYLQMWFYFGY